jgi:hypothetical protein
VTVARITEHCESAVLIRHFALSKTFVVAVFVLLYAVWSCLELLVFSITIFQFMFISLVKFLFLFHFSQFTNFEKRFLSNISYFQKIIPIVWSLVHGVTWRVWEQILNLKGILSLKRNLFCREAIISETLLMEWMSKRRFKLTKYTPNLQRFSFPRIILNLNMI